MKTYSFYSLSLTLTDEIAKAREAKDFTAVEVLEEMLEQITDVSDVKICDVCKKPSDNVEEGSCPKCSASCASQRESDEQDYRSIRLENFRGL